MASTTFLDVQPQHSGDDLLERRRRVRGRTSRSPGNVSVRAHEHGTVRIDPVGGAPVVRQSTRISGPPITATPNGMSSAPLTLRAASCHFLPSVPVTQHDIRSEQIQRRLPIAADLDPGVRRATADTRRRGRLDHGRPFALGPGHDGA